MANPHKEEVEFQRLLDRANHGDADAQFAIGLRYRHGIGVDKDILEAIGWYKIAGYQLHDSARAELQELANDPPAGDVRIIFELGKTFFLGNGTFVDRQKGISLFQAAAELGHVDAPYYLAFIYDDGGATGEREPQKALRYFSEASDRGHEVASLLFGLIKDCTPFSERALAIYGAGLQTQKKIWIDRAYRLVCNAEHTGNTTSWYETLSSLLRTCVEKEVIDAWVPLANKKIQAALAYFFLGASDHIAEAMLNSQRFAKIALAFAWANSELLPDMDFETKLQFVLSLEPVFGDSPFIGKFSETMEGNEIDFEYGEQPLNRSMYMRGGWFANDWLITGLDEAPDTAVLRDCLRRIDRTTIGSVADPGEAITTVRSLVSATKSSYNERFFLRHRRFFRASAFLNFPFSSDHLEKLSLMGEEKADWGQISSNQSILWSNSLIILNAGDLDMERLCENPAVTWDYELVDRICGFFDWSALSYSPSLKLTPALIDNYGHNLCWAGVCGQLDNNIFETLLTERPDLIQFDALSSNRNISWTPEIIERHKDEWNWKYLGINNSVEWTPELLRRYKEKIELRDISGNPNFPWSLDFIETHSGEIDWQSFSENTGKFWTQDLIERLAEKLDFCSLSKNVSIPWSEELISRYEDRLNWAALSSNPALPWSLEFLERYKDKWTWISEFGYISNMLFGKGLSGNPNLPWCHALVDKYAEQLDSDEVAKVYSGGVELLQFKTVVRLLNEIG